MTCWQLRETRESLGLSQSKLARRFGITRQTIGNYEAGRQYCPVYALALLALSRGFLAELADA